MSGPNEVIQPDGSTSDAAVLLDASTGGDSSIAPPDASVQDAAKPPPKIIDPKPPQGSSLCKSGTFTGADVRAACAAGNNGFGCDGVTTNGGRYEMWCTPVGAGVANPLRWIWVRFDDVVSSGTLGPACGLGSAFKVMGFYSTVDADGRTGFGPTGVGANDPGVQSSRAGVDDLTGNQIAVSKSFVDAYTTIRLSVNARCPKVGAVEVSPMKMVFDF